MIVLKAPQKRNNEDKSQRQPKGDAIIVDIGDNSSEKSYLETLKRLKENIKDEMILQDIRRVRKRAKGDLLIAVKGKPVNIKEVVKEYSKNGM